MHCRSLLLLNIPSNLTDQAQAVAAHLRATSSMLRSPCRQSMLLESSKHCRCKSIAVFISRTQSGSRDSTSFACCVGSNVANSLTATRVNRYTPTANLSLCRVLSISSPCVGAGRPEDGDLTEPWGTSAEMGDAEGGGDKLSWVLGMWLGENDRLKRPRLRGSGLLVGCALPGWGVLLPLFLAHTGIVTDPSTNTQAVVAQYEHLLVC